VEHLDEIVFTDPVLKFFARIRVNDFGVALIQCGLSVHTKLLPGSVNAAMPTDAIDISI
jgi:hypothetical protein